MHRQLLLTKELILHLGVAMESRLLSNAEHTFRAELKLKALGLASLGHTIARQRSRVLYLQEGDANTRFFHTQAHHRHRSNHMVALAHAGVLAVDHDAKEALLFDFYGELFRASLPREHDIDLAFLGVPSLDLQQLEVPFTNEELWAAIKELPPDKAPGPDGFSSRFYQSTWAIIKGDIKLAV